VIFEGKTIRAELAYSTEEKMRRDMVAIFAEAFCTLEGNTLRFLVKSSLEN